MNFLAHAYLSGNNDQIRFGNLIADAVKGDSYTQFPVEIQKGILLHRFIDSFTDQHPIVEESKILLREKFHKYAPVVSDVYFDHFLAKNWHEFHHAPLENYAQETYRILEAYSAHTPSKSKLFIPWLIQQNWLVSYKTTDGISQILGRMSNRAKFVSNMELAGEELIARYGQYEDHFRRYFPELIKASTVFKESLVWEV